MLLARARALKNKDFDISETVGMELLENYEK